MLSAKYFDSNFQITLKELLLPSDFLFQKSNVGLLRMKSFQLILFVSISSIAYIGCLRDSPKERLVNQVINDGKITQVEAQQLIRKPEWYGMYINDGKIDTTAFKDYLKSQRKKSVYFENLKLSEVKLPTYKVYLENSGSMDGFVKGKTEFETSIYSFLSDLNIPTNKLSKELELYYVNSQTIPFEPDVEDFIDKLEPSTFSKRGGDRSSSDIKEIIERVLAVSNDSSVGIFISDCLLSLPEAKDAQEFLNNQSVGFKTIFSSKLQQEQELMCLVMKLESSFSGKFYKHDNTSIDLDKAKRPYYIWVIGQQDYLLRLINELDLSTSLKGNLIDYHVWRNSSGSKAAYRTTNYKSGMKFIPSKYDTKHAIKEVRKSGTEQQTLTIAVNFKVTGFSDSYLTDVNNYSINEGVGSLKITGIKTITKADIQTIGYLSEYTHLITIDFGSKIPKKEIVTIDLLNNIPRWVEDEHWEPSMKDRNEIEKTFGLKYLIEGLNDGYYGSKRENTNKISSLVLTFE